MNLVLKCLAIAVLAATAAFGANDIQAYAGLNLFLKAGYYLGLLDINKSNSSGASTGYPRAFAH